MRRCALIISACILVAGLGIGAVFTYRQHNTAKPVEDRVSMDASQTGGNITVGDSSTANNAEQAEGGSSVTSNTGVTTNNSSSGTIQVNPSTFSQYDTAKYEDANAAYYTNLQTGTGTTVSKPGQKAVVSYKGWLTNGTLFDETKVNAQGQSEAFEFTYEASPEQVIPGFDEGVSGMKVGGTRLIVVPPTAGYGSTAHNGIPANSILVFEITLDEIQ